MLLFRWHVHINRISVSVFRNCRRNDPFVLVLTITHPLKWACSNCNAHQKWRQLIVNTKKATDSKIYDGQLFLNCHSNNNQRMIKVVTFTINLKLTFLFPS